MIKRLFKRNKLLSLFVVILTLGGCYLSTMMFDYPTETENVTSTSGVATQTAIPREEEINMVYYVCTNLADHDGTVNLRELPDPDSEIVRTLRENLIVLGDAKFGEWRHIILINQTEGWTHINYLCEVK